MLSQNSAICWKLRVSDATSPRAVKMRSVRTISRKDRTQCSESSETNTPSTCKGEDRVRSVRRRAESGRNDLAPDSSGVTMLVTLSVAPEVTDFNVWQSRQPARRENKAQLITISGQFAQWNEYTVPLVFGKGVQDTTSATEFAFPSDTDALAEHAIVVDATDGSDDHRFYFSRANQTGTSEVTFNRDSLAVLPFEFSALAPAGGGSPGSYFTDSGGFAAGS